MEAAKGTPGRLTFSEELQKKDKEIFGKIKVSFGQSDRSIDPNDLNRWSSMPPNLSGRSIQ